MMTAKPTMKPSHSDNLRRFLKNLKNFDFRPKKVFNVSLDESLSVSSINTSLTTLPGYTVRIPTIVFVCTRFLREHGRDVKGLFRVSGSIKRMQRLQILLGDGPSYGMNLDLKPLGFTPHDVANTLTRYLNALTEPVIPHNQFKNFRDVLENTSEPCKQIEKFKELLHFLEPSHLHLLLFLLDFLAEFAEYFENTLMPSSNLSAVFQPSILANPEHVHIPEEYVKSQQVLEFLIINYRTVAQTHNTLPLLDEEVKVNSSLRRSLTNLPNKARFLMRNRSLGKALESSLSDNKIISPPIHSLDESCLSTSPSLSTKSRRFTFFG